MENNLYEKNTDGTVLFIRHGQTQYNQIETPENKDEVKLRQDLLDCPLNVVGRKQAEEAQAKLNEFKVKYVYSSPLMRCLESTYFALQNHPDRQSFKVVVCPLITETVHGVHDFTIDLQKKKSQFNLESEVKFDWGFFDSCFPDPKAAEVYFLEYVDNVDSSTKKKVEEMKAQLLENATPELLVKFATYFRDLKKRPETFKRMLQRGLDFNRYISTLKKELSPNEKILVFTHSTFIMILDSKKAREMETIPDFEFPDDCYKPTNFEILSMNVDI
jgi:broad specificity phosphatase PhoE